MYRLCFALMMFADLAGAATIVKTSVTCDGVTTSALRCYEDGAIAATIDFTTSFPYFFEMDTSVDRGHSAGASASLQTEVPVTVVSGPATGYFDGCVTVGADAFQGFATVGASLGEASVGASDGHVQNESCGNVPYTLGVTQFLPLSITASASAFPYGLGGEAGVFAVFNSFEVLDSAGNYVFAPVVKFTESPEPTPAILVCCGVLLLCIIRRGLARIGGAA